MTSCGRRRKRRPPTGRPRGANWRPLASRPFGTLVSVCWAPTLLMLFDFALPCPCCSRPLTVIYSRRQRIAHRREWQLAIGKTALNQFSCVYPPTELDHLVVSGNKFASNQIGLDLDDCEDHRNDARIISWPRERLIIQVPNGKVRVAAS